MPIKRKAVVAVNSDGTEKGRWTSVYELCRAEGLKKDWVRKSCNTGSLYHGVRYMWAEDFDQAVSGSKTEYLCYHVREWRRNVAFSFDFRGTADDCLMFLFKGATVSILRQVFDLFCSNNIIKGYDIRETHDVARLWRHQYWRLEVWPIGYDSTFASLRDSIAIIDMQLRSLVKGAVDFYLIEDFLNLTDRRPEAVNEAWKSLEATAKKEKTSPTTRKNKNNHQKINDMPKIYVRVPGLIAGFYRGMNRDKHPDNFEPYEFPDHDDLLYFLEKQLRFIPEQNQSMYCLSERAFNHLLHGKMPGGGRQIMNRDPKLWPDMKEICALTGKFVTDKNESADYLCIGIPKEILDGGEIRRTNGSYCLSKKMADVFIAYMRQRFKRELDAFIREDIQNCERFHIKRSDVERMDRFMAAYNMPISIDERERESLRKVIHRIKKQREKQPFLDEDLDEFVYHISEDDLKKTERWNKKQERISKKR